MSSQPKRFLVSVICVIVMVCLGAEGRASILLLTPNDADWSGSVPNNPDVDDVELITGFGADLTELYKADVDSSTESGSFAGNYTTVFSNTASDPSDATITWDGGAFIDNALFLKVKDGNHDPIWYIFDITGWDGQMQIDLEGFWPEGGAISHVAIYGADETEEPVIPEPASIAIWLSMILGASLFYRRFGR